MAIAYYKFIGNNLINRGFQYKLGMNIDTQVFKPNENCGPGLYFSEVSDLLGWHNDSSLRYLAEVKVPNGVRIAKFGDKSKAPKIEITKLHDLSTVEGFKFFKDLVENNGDEFESDIIATYLGNLDTHNNEPYMLDKAKAIIENFSHTIDDASEIIDLIIDCPLSLEVYLVTKFKHLLTTEEDIDAVIDNTSRDNENEVRAVLTNKNNINIAKPNGKVYSAKELFAMDKNELITLILGESPIIGKLCYVSDCNEEPDLDDYETIAIVTGYNSSDDMWETDGNNWEYAVPVKLSEITKHIIHD